MWNCFDLPELSSFGFQLDLHGIFRDKVIHDWQKNTGRVMSEPSSSAPRRDPFLDSWRGIFHVVMMVDHLPFVLPGVFTTIAWFYEAAGYVTVAEGFVFLSGFVSGLVYTRIKREKGNLAMWRKALARASGIYVCYVLAVVGLLAVVRAFGSSRITWAAWEPLFYQPLGSAFVQVTAILQQPTFLEILPMYSGLLLVTPLLIGQLEKSRSIVVLVLSLSIWIAAQFKARNDLLNLVPFHSLIHVGYFNALGWQLLFVSGLVCGHKTCAANGRWLPDGWLLPVAAYSLVRDRIPHAFHALCSTASRLDQARRSREAGA